MRNEERGGASSKTVEVGGGEDISWVKRGLDLLCLVLASPALVLIMGGIAVFIKLACPGPVFFRQERIGYRGRRFPCLKFRTMKARVSGQSHQDHVSRLMATDVPMTKLDVAGDPRLIPMGAWLRATGLDELPQVLNVWRGEMSLVGPRPCTTYEYAHYRPDQHERFNAPPGLTGLWQVSGKNHTTFSQMIALDVAYVRSQSVWLDLRILARTVGVLVEQVRQVRRAARRVERHARVPSVPVTLADRLGQPEGLLGSLDPGAQDALGLGEAAPCLQKSGG